MKKHAKEKSLRWALFFSCIFNSTNRWVADNIMLQFLWGLSSSYLFMCWAHHVKFAKLNSFKDKMTLIHNNNNFAPAAYCIYKPQCASRCWNCTKMQKIIRKRNRRWLFIMHIKRSRLWWLFHLGISRSVRLQCLCIL